MRGGYGWPWSWVAKWTWDPGWVALWPCCPDSLCRDIRVVERKDRTCGYWMVILILAIAIVLVLAL